GQSASKIGFSTPQSHSKLSPQWLAEWKTSHCILKSHSCESGTGIKLKIYNPATRSPAILRRRAAARFRSLQMENPVMGSTPYLTVSDGKAAIEFYKKALGAT